MIYPPCKVNGVDCDKRFPNCHSTCKKYAEFKKKKAEESNALRKQMKEAYFDKVNDEKRQSFGYRRVNK